MRRVIVLFGRSPPKPIRDSWQLVGWIEDHVSRVLLIAGALGAAITAVGWAVGRMTGVPPFYLYIGTIALLVLGLWGMVAASLLFRQGPLVSAVASADAVQVVSQVTSAASYVEELSEGIMWRSYAGNVGAFCPEHGVQLLFKDEEGNVTWVADGHRFVRRTTYDHEAGSLFCPEPQATHTLKPSESPTYYQAKIRAAAVLAQRRQRRTTQ
jgi:hypothetical protein